MDFRLIFAYVCCSGCIFFAPFCPPKKKAFESRRRPKKLVLKNGVAMPGHIQSCLEKSLEFASANNIRSFVRRGTFLTKSYPIRNWNLCASFLDPSPKSRAFLLGVLLGLQFCKLHSDRSCLCMETMYVMILHTTDSIHIQYRVGYVRIVLILFYALCSNTNIGRVAQEVSKQFCQKQG